jgi:hypothetical protein
MLICKKPLLRFMEVFLFLVNPHGQRVFVFYGYSNDGLCPNLLLNRFWYPLTCLVFSFIIHMQTCFVKCCLLVITLQMAACLYNFSLWREVY